MFMYAIHTHTDNNLILQSCFLSFAIPSMYTHDQKILALTESMKMTLLSGDKTSIVLFPGNYSSWYWHCVCKMLFKTFTESAKSVDIFLCKWFKKYLKILCWISKEKFCKGSSEII